MNFVEIFDNFLLECKNSINASSGDTKKASARLAKYTTAWSLTKNNDQKFIESINRVLAPFYSAIGELSLDNIKNSLLKSDVKFEINVVSKNKNKNKDKKPCVFVSDIYKFVSNLEYKVRASNLLHQLMILSRAVGIDGLDSVILQQSAALLSFLNNAQASAAAPVVEIKDSAQQMKYDNIIKSIDNMNDFLRNARKNSNAFRWLSKTFGVDNPAKLISSLIKFSKRNKSIVANKLVTFDSNDKRNSMIDIATWSINAFFDEMEGKESGLEIDSMREVVSQLEVASSKFDANKIFEKASVQDESKEDLDLEELD